MQFQIAAWNHFYTSTFYTLKPDIWTASQFKATTSGRLPTAGLPPNWRPFKGLGSGWSLTGLEGWQCRPPMNKLEGQVSQWSGTRQVSGEGRVSVWAIGKPSIGIIPSLTLHIYRYYPSRQSYRNPDSCQGEPRGAAWNPISDTREPWMLEKPETCLGNQSKWGLTCVFKLPPQIFKRWPPSTLDAIQGFGIQLDLHRPRGLACPRTADRGTYRSWEEQVRVTRVLEQGKCLERPFIAGYYRCLTSTQFQALTYTNARISPEGKREGIWTGC